MEYMKKEVLIVKNITREGPGLLEELLNEKGIQYSIIDLDKGEAFPPVENYKAVVVCGGPDSANDDNEKIHNELERIRECVDANIPYLGICLGLQTLVKALGGKVVPNSVKEIGFRDPENNRFTVELTEEGKHDPLFKDLGNEFKVFHLHGETVELATDMILLGIGKFCQNQIVKVGSNAYGIQCHFELTPEMFELWITEDSDLINRDKDMLESDFESSKEEYTKTGRQLFGNFLNIAGF
jgi:GMP synthase-like glutamine amidotransferase